MSWAKYEGFHLAKKQGLPCASVSTDGNGTGFDRLTYSHMIAVLNVGAVTGTTPTLDVKVQHATALSGSYADYTPDVIFDNGDTTVTTAKFAQVTDADANTVVKMDVDLAKARRYIRFVKTVGGTQPVFLCSVDALLGQYDRSASPGYSG